MARLGLELQSLLDLLLREITARSGKLHLWSDLEGLGFFERDNNIHVKRRWWSGSNLIDPTGPYPCGNRSLLTLIREMCILAHELGHLVSFRESSELPWYEEDGIARGRLRRGEGLTRRECSLILQEELRAWRIGWSIVRLGRPSWIVRWYYVAMATDKLIGYASELLFLGAIEVVSPRRRIMDRPTKIDLVAFGVCAVMLATLVVLSFLHPSIARFTTVLFR